MTYQRTYLLNLKIANHGTNINLGICSRICYILELCLSSKIKIVSYKNNNRNPNTVVLNGQTPVNDYLTAKCNRNQRLWKIKDGQMITEVGGKEMTAQEFDKLYPATYKKPGKENVDSTTNWRT